MSRCQDRDMATPRERVKLLIARSRSQLENLRVLLEREDLRPNHTARFGVEDNRPALFIENLREPDPDLELTLVEAAGNARKALDRAVAHIAVGTGLVTMDGHRGGFPVLLVEEGAGRQFRSLLRHVPADARTVIEAVQPYHRADPSLHPLALLNAIANDDKHRGGQPGQVLTRNIKMILTDHRVREMQVYDLAAQVGTIGERVALRDGQNVLAGMSDARLAPLWTHVDARDGETEFITRTVTGFAFGERLLLFSELVGLVDFVEFEVVPRLEPWIPHG